MWTSYAQPPFGFGHQHAFLTIRTADNLEIQLLQHHLRIESYDYLLADFKGGHSIHTEFSKLLQVLQVGIDIFFDEGDPFTAQEILGCSAVGSGLRTI